MRLKSTAAVVVGALGITGLALTASPGQQGTRTPGQMTEAHVWIDNHGREEAIPVDLRDIHIDRPLRVQVVNNDPEYGSSGPVHVRPVRVLWDYQTLVVPRAADLAMRLNTQGALGWEAIGVLSQTAEATTVLLKRQR
jgi:hypothetical protein